jgi:DNA (cytosine-5)-methyltransferase 1
MGGLQSASKDPLTVGDLFCGAGGFAEGFRQAGFLIKWGVDLWAPAVETFQKNFPSARARRADILDFEPADLGPVTVLIGSPPCVHFSPANRGGGGDKESGMELVSRLLTFVRELKPKYWVMENVPALLPHLEARMQGDEYRDESLHIAIPVRTVIDAATLGVPQNRRRLFSGRFPIPRPAQSSDGVHSTLRDVVDSFPDPVEGALSADSAVTDPIYPGLSIRSGNLRDHLEDPRWTLTKDEVESTRERRERDRIYGVMPFPDGLDRPARTITSTKTKGSRATIVIPWPARIGVPFRTLTLRECASAQGFPLSYQFWADSMSTKDALVGNAVPPPVARAIAHAILAEEGRQIPSAPILGPDSDLPPILTYRRMGPRRFSMRRRFRGPVPVDWRRDHRVELDNELPGVRSRLPPDIMPPITWRSRLYLGYATRYRCYELRFPSALRLAQVLTDDPRAGLDAQAMTGLLLSVVQATLNGFQDGINLQEEWSGWRSTGFGPRRLLSMVGYHVGRAFPASEWGQHVIAASVTDPVLRGCSVYSGEEASPEQPIDASSRLLASAVSLSLLCERLNFGTDRLEPLHGALTSPRGIRSMRVQPLLQPDPIPSGGRRRSRSLAIS